jgi:predicted HTH domain antitoxin
MSKSAFGQLLGKREIPRQYDEADLQDDFNYVSGK